MKDIEIDCVQMKNEIQSQLQKAREGKSDEEIEALIEKRLEDSDSPVARFWKRLTREVA